MCTHVYAYTCISVYILDIRSSLGLFGKVDLTEKSILRLMRSTEWTELLCRRTSRGFLYGPRTFQTVCVGKVCFHYTVKSFEGLKLKGRSATHSAADVFVTSYTFPLWTFWSLGSLVCKAERSVWDSPLEQGAQEVTQPFLKSGQSTGGGCGVCSQVPFGVCHPPFGFLSPHAHLE